MARVLSSFRRDPKFFVLRLWSYFRRGHSTYLVFFVSFANFVVIQYRLVVEYVPFLHYLFESLATFALTFLLVYVPLAVLIGWLDFKKFAVPVDNELMTRANPWARDLAEALILIAEGRNREAVELLRKWARG